MKRAEWLGLLAVVGAVILLLISFTSTAETSIQHDQADAVLVKPTETQKDPEPEDIEEELPSLAPQNCSPDECITPTLWIRDEFGKLHEGGRSQHTVALQSLMKKQPPNKCYNRQPGQQLSIGLTTFATGGYINYANEFVKTAAKYFFPHDNVTLFLFTNRKEPNLPIAPGQRVIIIHAPHLEWPKSSMQRFSVLHEHRDQFAHLDYIYNYDVDYEFLYYICDEYLGDLVGVIQPQYPCRFNQPHTLPYDRNPKSTAFVPESDGEFYFMGSQFGGKPHIVRSLVATCKQNQEIDEANNQHARVDDESHLNRYFVQHPPSVVLSKSYVMYLPQGHYGCWFPIIHHRPKPDLSEIRNRDLIETAT